MTQVMCLPYAGAGAGVYRPWKALASDRARAVPIQLPGREEEFTKACWADFAEAAAGTAERIVAAAAGEPFVIFGHSFGALLAYETVRHLLATGGPLPRRLIVSGSRSPRHRGYRPLSDNDDEAVAGLELDGQRGFEALNHPELRALLLPVLRADARLLSTYEPSGLDPLPVPLTALRGTTDTVAAPVEEWDDWKTFTTEEYTALHLPGGHLYLLDAMPELWRVIEEQL